MGKRNTDHLGMGDGGKLICLHCGGTYDPHGADGRGVELGMLAAISKQFEKLHARCPRPKKPLCSFCLKPDHPWHEHVNATTRDAVQWITCGDTGLSSKTIWAHMLRYGMPAGCPAEPRDGDDFGRCYRLLAAPWALGWRERIGEMRGYPRWAGIVARWAELEALYVTEMAGGTPGALYALMREIQGEGP